MVEHQPSKLNVARSSRVARFELTTTYDNVRVFLFFCGTRFGAISSPDLPNHSQQLLLIALGIDLCRVHVRMTQSRSTCVDSILRSNLRREVVTQLTCRRCVAAGMFESRSALVSKSAQVRVANGPAPAAGRAAIGGKPLAGLFAFCLDLGQVEFDFIRRARRRLVDAFGQPDQQNRARGDECPGLGGAVVFEVRSVVLVGGLHLGVGRR